MRTALSMLAALLVAAVASAQPAVILPEVKPAPMPAPMPGAAAKLTGDSLYVVRSNDPCVVTASALGFVKITQETGPLRIRGRFIDGAGTETRNFTEKNLWIVEAATTGRCELLVIPVGTTAEKDVIRRTLDVDAGEGPRPPPGPGPDPGPKPPGPKPVKELRVLIVEESGDRMKLPAAQQDIILGEEMRVFLDEKTVLGPDGKTHEWRIWDKDTPLTSERPVWKTLMGKARTSVPWIVLADGEVPVFEGPLPANTADTKALIQKYLTPSTRPGK